MKVRPSQMYYCGMCETDHVGRPKQTEAPVFTIGCCWELEWSGTREQAGELYDYLVSEGQLFVRTKCAEGNIDFDDDISDPHTVWICGECGNSYSECDYHDAKLRGINCCAEVLAARRGETGKEPF